MQIKKLKFFDFHITTMSEIWNSYQEKLKEFNSLFEEREVIQGIIVNLIVGEGGKIGIKYKFPLKKSDETMNIISEVIRSTPDVYAENYTYGNTIEGISVYSSKKENILSVAKSEDEIKIVCYTLKGAEITDKIIDKLWAKRE